MGRLSPATAHAHRQRAHRRPARSRCRRAFAFDEPGYQAGVYRDVLLRRWRNLLERTMWDFPGGRTGGNRYLVLGLGTGQAANLAVPPDQDELIRTGRCCCPTMARPGWVRRRWSERGTRDGTRHPDPGRYAASGHNGNSAGGRHDP